MMSLAVEDEHPAHRIVRMLYAKFVTELPAIGTFFSRLGGVEASTSNGAVLLKRGEAVGIFPEGEEALGKPYHQAYCLRPFRTGVAPRSTRRQAPVVPAARAQFLHERAEYVRLEVQRLLDVERLRRRAIYF